MEEREFAGASWLCQVHVCRIGVQRTAALLQPLFAPRCPSLAVLHASRLSTLSPRAVALFQFTRAAFNVPQSVAVFVNGTVALPDTASATVDLSSKGSAGRDGAYVASLQLPVRVFPRDIALVVDTAVKALAENQTTELRIRLTRAPIVPVSVAVSIRCCA